MKNKIALGIVTNDKPEFLEEVLDNTPFDLIDKVYVWDSGEVKYDNHQYNINTGGKTTVGVAKNELMERMYEDGYEHIFLQEHDVKITNEDVFNLYIETAKVSGIKGTLNFAWHGNGNLNKDGSRNIKLQADLGDGLGIEYTHNGVAPFSYIHSDIIDHFGYHDENYINCWEHLDYYQLQSEADHASYFWWFTDAKNSHLYLSDIDGGNHDGSVIRKDSDWKENMIKGAEYFKKRYRHTPIEMPHVSQKEVENRLDYLIEEFSV